MATIPDLDTTSVGYIAYWNALDDGGVSSIAPDEVTSFNSITSTQLYDNGVTGTLDTGYAQEYTREVNFRVKNDGWMIVYTDRTNTFTTTTTNRGDLVGYYDLIDDWTGGSEGNSSLTRSPSISPQNVLERGINGLRTELSNSGSMTYNPSDVGLFNYEYNGATNSTYFYLEGANGGSSASFSYTSNTDLKYLAVVGVIYTDVVDNNQQNVFEGVTVLDADNTGTITFGGIDAVSRGLVGSAGTSYSYSTNTRQDFEWSRGDILAIWS